MYFCSQFFTLWIFGKKNFFSKAKPEHSDVGHLTLPPSENRIGKTSSTASCESRSLFSQLWPCPVLENRRTLPTICDQDFFGLNLPFHLSRLLSFFLPSLLVFHLEFHMDAIGSLPNNVLSMDSSEDYPRARVEWGPPLATQCFISLHHFFPRRYQPSLLYCC